MAAKVYKTGEKVHNKDLYNVEAEGKTYPTTNPEFRPDPSATKINFDQPDNRVKVITAGKPEGYDLSREEYSGQLVTRQTIALDEELAAKKQEGAEKVFKQEGAQEERMNLAKAEGAADVQRERGILPPLPSETSVRDLEAQGQAQPAPEGQNIPPVQPATQPMAAPSLPMETQPSVPQEQDKGLVSTYITSLAQGVIKASLYARDEAGILIQPEFWKGEQVQLPSENLEGMKQKMKEWSGYDFNKNPIKDGDFQTLFLTTAAAAALAEIGPATLIKETLARLGGAKNPAAAIASGRWIFRPSVIIQSAISHVAKFAFSGKGIVAGTALTGLNYAARGLGSMAIADMKDQAAYLKDGLISYDEARTNYEEELVNFARGKKLARYLSKIPVLNAFAKGIGTQTYFEIEQRNIDAGIYLQQIEQARADAAVVQAKQRYGR
jgi:hypothetical protein